MPVALLWWCFALGLHAPLVFAGPPQVILYSEIQSTCDVPDAASVEQLATEAVYAGLIEVPEPSAVPLVCHPSAR